MLHAKRGDRRSTAPLAALAACVACVVIVAACTEPTGVMLADTHLSHLDDWTSPVVMGHPIDWAWFTRFAVPKKGDRRVSFDEDDDLSDVFEVGSGIRVALDSSGYSAFNRDVEYPNRTGETDLDLVYDLYVDGGADLGSSATCLAMTPRDPVLACTAGNQLTVDCSSHHIYSYEGTAHYLNANADTLMGGRPADNRQKETRATSSCTPPAVVVVDGTSYACDLADDIYFEWIDDDWTYEGGGGSIGICENYAT